MSINATVRQPYPTQACTIGATPKSPIRQQIEDVKQEVTKLHQVIELVFDRLKYITTSTPMSEIPANPPEPTEIEHDLGVILNEVRHACSRLNNLVDSVRL